MHRSVEKTRRAKQPGCDPAALIASLDRSVFPAAAGRNALEGPPGWTAFSCPEPVTPPARAMRSATVSVSGRISYTPGRATSPVTVANRVGGPDTAASDQLSLTMRGRLAKVSQL